MTTDPDPSPDLDWGFVRFGLIVTGKTEEQHLPKLFRCLHDLRPCNFKVISRIGQRSPISSEKRLLRMVGTGKLIPDRDASEIGLPARHFLGQENAFVLLVDDLEYTSVANKPQKYQRYRDALDHILTVDSHRASIHFLVNMIEAYYFADAQAINSVLGTTLDDYQGDVETIRHPKNDLSQIMPDFDPIIHGGAIIARLEISHVLSRPESCASLRTLFSWCAKALNRQLSEDFCLANGRYCGVASQQLHTLEQH